MLEQAQTARLQSCLDFYLNISSIQFGWYFCVCDKFERSLENGIACIPAITQQACACVIFLIFARKFQLYMHIFFAPHQVYQFYTELINSNAIRLTRKSRTRRPNEFHFRYTRTKKTCDTITVGIFCIPQ